MTYKTRMKDEFARVVHDYLLIEQTTLIPADFALVFGNKNIIEPLADRTAELYHTGHFPLVVASGGVKTRNRKTEAEALQYAFIKRGIPAEAILIEKQAVHTGENVTLTRALLREKGMAEKISSVMSIGHIKAGRRFLMTLERHWPEIHKMHSSANPYGISAKDWHLDDRFRKDVMEQWRKIVPYLAQDHIREVDMAALERVTSYLKAIRECAPANALPSGQKPEPASA